MILTFVQIIQIIGIPLSVMHLSDASLTSKIAYDEQ